MPNPIDLAMGYVGGHVKILLWSAGILGLIGTGIYIEHVRTRPLVEQRDNALQGERVAEGNATVSAQAVKAADNTARRESNVQSKAQVAVQQISSASGAYSLVSPAVAVSWASAIDSLRAEPETSVDPNTGSGGTEAPLSKASAPHG